MSSSSASSSLGGIPSGYKFDGTQERYQIWVKMFTSWLITQNLESMLLPPSDLIKHEPTADAKVNQDRADADEKAKVEYSMKSNNVYIFLMQAITSSMTLLQLIEHCEGGCAYEVWLKLKKK